MHNQLADCLLFDHWPQVKPNELKGEEEKKTNPSQNKCVFSSENFFYHQTKRIKDDLCVFFLTKWTFFSLRTPFFSCVVCFIESDHGGTSHRQMVPQPNNSVVVNNKNKFLVNTFRKMRERENRWLLICIGHHPIPAMLLGVLFRVYTSSCLIYFGCFIKPTTVPTLFILCVAHYIRTSRLHQCWAHINILIRQN